jgi:hypothetical protein
MQPYFLPYIGYWQLINAVDTFVILDDVNYINKGWINRNNILVNEQAKLFTIPLTDASQNKKINEISISDDSKWSASLLKTIEYNYKKAPFYNQIFPLIEESVLFSDKNLSAFIYNSIKIVCNYLNIETQIIPSSSVYSNSELKSSARILDICIKANADEYINPIGGTELYQKEAFLGKGINLHFLKTSEIRYSQFSDTFIPWLSILDVMMFNSPDEIKSILEKHSLI